jgi:hypothetical protein
MEGSATAQRKEGTADSVKAGSAGAQVILGTEKKIKEMVRWMS